MKKKYGTETIISTWFYSGLIPPIILKGMAGTYGSLAAIPFCLGALYISRHFDYLPVYYAVLTLAIFCIGLSTIPKAEKELGECRDWKGKIKTRDQNQIVIDEVLGMYITYIPLLFLPFRWEFVVYGFLLFRLFDIIKPPGCRFFDKMKNSLGVMMDDFVAGAYAAICLIAIAKFFY